MKGYEMVPEFKDLRVDEIEMLLAVPGMDLALRAAPFAGFAVWLVIVFSLWRGGFRDLTEKLTRPRWAGRERARALAMLPLRALLLAGVAAFAAGMTLLGLLFNAAVVLNILQVVRAG
jgi:hypothetical protein